MGAGLSIEVNATAESGRREFGLILKADFPTSAVRPFADEIRPGRTISLRCAKAIRVGDLAVISLLEAPPTLRLAMAGQIFTRIRE